MSSEDHPETDVDTPENLEKFSFDDWCQLHETSPEQFDRLRLKLLNDFIDSAEAKSRSRLRGLMFTMAGESKRSKSPMGYNLRLSAMMMKMLEEMRSQIHSLCSTDYAELDDRLPQSSEVNVIPFTQPAKSEEF